MRRRKIAGTPANPMLTLLVAAYAIIVVIGALRPIPWPAEPILSVFPQLFIAGLILTANALRARRPLAGAAAGTAALTTLAMTGGQFAPPDRIEGKPDARVFWANVYGKPDAFDAAVREGARRGADIVLLGETPLKRRDASLRQARALYPYVDGDLAGKTSGVTALSHTPLDAFRIQYTPGRNSVIIRMKIDGAPLVIGAVHPTVPLSPRYLAMRNEHLAAAAHGLRAEKYALMIGDFNTTPWSPTARRLARDAALRRVSHGFAPTWGAPIPFFGLPIDLAYVGDGLDGAARLGPANGSDHRSLIVDLKFARD